VLFITILHGIISRRYTSGTSYMNRNIDGPPFNGDARKKNALTDVLPKQGVPSTEVQEKYLVGDEAVQAIQNAEGLHGFSADREEEPGSSVNENAVESAVITVDNPAEKKEKKGGFLASLFGEEIADGVEAVDPAPKDHTSVAPETVQDSPVAKTEGAQEVVQDRRGVQEQEGVGLETLLKKKETNTEENQREQGDRVEHEDSQEKVRELSKEEIEYKASRKEYKRYKKELHKVRENFEKLADEYKEESEKSGFLSRFMDTTPELRKKKKEMEEALVVYDHYLEKIRNERERRIQASVEKFSTIAGAEKQEDEVQYIALHEALLEKQIDNEAAMLESIKQRENKDGEPNFFALRWMKKGLGYYSKLPKAGRIAIGAGIGAAVGSLAAVGAGAAAGGVLAAGVAGGFTKGARKTAGVFLAPLAALETKKFLDKEVDVYEEVAMTEQKNTFSEKKLSESRRERKNIKRNVRWGKRSATVGAAGAAMIVGGGGSALAENVADGVVDTIGDVHFGGVAEANAATEAPQHSALYREVEASRKAFEEGGNSNPEMRSAVQNIMGKAEAEYDGTAEVAVNSATPEITGTHDMSFVDTEEQRPERTVLTRPSGQKSFFQNKFDEAQERVALRRASGVPAGEVAGEQMVTEQPEGGVEHVPAAEVAPEQSTTMEALQQSSEGALTEPVTEGWDIQRILQHMHEQNSADMEHVSTGEVAETPAEAPPTEEQPEVLTAVGEYETGSSVNKELQEFLGKDTWVQEHYPNIDEDMRGKIAHRLYLELAKDHEAMERFKVRGDDWNSVHEGDHYSVGMKRELVEKAIKRFYPEEGTQEVASTMERRSVAQEALDELRAEKTPVPTEESVPAEAAEGTEPVHLAARHKVLYGDAKYEPQHIEADEHKILRKHPAEVQQSNEPTPQADKGVWTNPDDHKPFGSERKTPVEEPVKAWKNPDVDRAGTAVPEEHSGEWKNPDRGEVLSSQAEADLKYAQMQMEKHEVPDYQGFKTRPYIEELFKEGHFDNTLEGRKNLILSNWGPISHVRMQDIYDNDKLLHFSFGDAAEPLTLSSGMEEMTKSMVNQFESNFAKKVPNIEEMIAQAREDNITLGEFVARLSDAVKEKADHADVAVESKEVPHVADVAVEQQVVVPEEIPQSAAADALEQVRAEIVYQKLKDYTVPKLPETVGKDGLYHTELQPVEVSEDVLKDIERNYGSEHPEWSEGTAAELYHSEAGKSFVAAIQEQMKDMAIDIPKASTVNMKDIRFDWAAMENMTPIEFLEQLEQHERMLERADGTETIIGS